MGEETEWYRNNIWRDCYWNFFSKFMKYINSRSSINPSRINSKKNIYFNKTAQYQRQITDYKQPKGILSLRDEGKDIFKQIKIDRICCQRLKSYKKAGLWFSTASWNIGRNE